MGPSFRRTQAKRPYSRRQLLANARHGGLARAVLFDHLVGASSSLLVQVICQDADNLTRNYGQYDREAQLRNMHRIVNIKTELRR